MKKDNQKPPHVVSKRHVLFAALFLPGLVLAAPSVDISPVVSSGNSVSYREEEKINLWFLLDDSGSMNIPAEPYDANVSYVVPEDITNPSATYPTTNWDIWDTYYRRKIDVLKSSLSVVLFNSANSHLTKNVRIGFRGFAPGPSTNALPLLPFYGPNETANKVTMYNWLWNMRGIYWTPLVDRFAKVVDEVTVAASDPTSNKNPFLENPGQAPDPVNNKILSCRRNYMLVMTDGRANSVQAEPIPPLINGIRVNTQYTLPDNETYTGDLAPYKNNAYRSCPGTGCIASLDSADRTTVADVALAAWKNDMDGDNSNNDLRPKNQEIAGVVPTLNGSEYWHPWNDPASWQHFSTFTMGFRMNPLQVNGNNISINPDLTPSLDPSITAPGFTWDVEQLDVISNYPGWDDFVETSHAGAVNDLANAALIGRGRYYDVRTPGDMINAFKNLLNSVQNPVLEVTVNAASGMGGGSQRLDNSYYVGRYDADNWTGELIKYNLYNGDPNMPCDGSPTVWGELCNTAWNAGERLTADGPGSRNIITLKRQKSGTDLAVMNDPGLTVGNINYKMVDFDPGNISPAQQTRLQNAFPSELTAITPAADRLPALFDYIRGDDTNEPGGGGTETFRNRNEHNYLNNDSNDDGSIHGDSDDVVARNILGAVMRASPVFVGIPNGYVKHFEGQGTIYNGYTSYVSSFINNNTNGEKEVVYVGANDGMLHAFKANTGEELFAYVPSAVYDKLPDTVVPAPEQQLSLVDGNIDVQSVYFNTNWYRALVGGMGGGAKGLYALNITEPTASAVKASSVINWEYGELESKLYQIDQGNPPVSNIGNIMVAPAIIQLQDNNWVAIVGNGYNSASNKAAVIVINLKTGKPIQELVLDTANTYSDATKPNGLGPLYFLSYPGKPRNESNQYDRAYAGDLQGNLWVFDLQGSDISTGIKVISQGSDTSGTPLFTAKDSANNRQPITVYPLAVKHPLNYGYLVHFGTGSLFAPDDLSSEIDNSIYAIWDDWVPSNKDGLPTPRTSTITDDRTPSSELNEVKLTQRNVTVDNDGNPINALVRELAPIGTNLGENQKTDWKLGSNGSHRGWRIDLDNGSTAYDSERAWQPAYTAYGAGNVQAIAYNTISYHEQGSATICETPGNRATSWQLTFNGNDAAVRLPRSGVLDINQDNSVTEADREILTGGTYVLQPYPLQGLATAGDILQNPSSQQLFPKEVNGGVIVDPNAPRTVCRSVTTLTALSGGVVTPSTVERCSYFSSWTELK